MRSTTICAILVLCAGACSPSPAEQAPDWFERSADAELPEAISGLGLYEGPGLEPRVPGRTWRFEPRWPLWSNGSKKVRDLYVPPGARLERRPEGGFVLPPGSMLFKTFLYGDAPVETRVMRVTPDGTWEYGHYQWSGEDAARLEMRRVVRVSVEVDGERFDHELPNKLQCRSCHESSPKGFVLGMTPREIGPEGLQALVERGWLEDPGAPVSGVEAASEPERWVKSYMLGNCVYCHNGWDGPSSAFDLGDDVFLENTIDRETEGNASAVGIRVVPGCPDDSVLFQAFARTSPDPELKPMPPEGVQRIDADALARLRSWIEALPPQSQKECSTQSE